MSALQARVEHARVNTAPTWTHPDHGGRACAPEYNMQRRAPQARGDGSASSALRWALHHHVAPAPCSTLETDARPEIRLRRPTPPGAPSPTTLAPPPIDAAPHLQRCPHRAKDARGRCQRSPVMFNDCAACALSTLQTIRALMIFYSPELYQ